MTFKEKIYEYLKETICFDQDIDLIMKDIQNDKDLFKPMRNAWDDQIDGYPEIVTIDILMSVDDFVLGWLKTQKPKHFLIPFFEERVYGTPIPEVGNENKL